MRVDTRIRIERSQFSFGRRRPELMAVALRSHYVNNTSRRRGAAAGVHILASGMGCLRQKKPVCVYVSVCVNATGACVGVHACSDGFDGRCLRHRTPICISSAHYRHHLLWMPTNGSCRGVGDERFMLSPATSYEHTHGQRIHIAQFVNECVSVPVAVR